MTIKEPLPDKRKPLFSAIAWACLVPGSILFYALSSRIDQGETLDGYSSLGIILSSIVVLMLSGLVTGQIGLIRGEKPIALPILALIINALVFMLVIVTIPR